MKLIIGLGDYSQMVDSSMYFIHFENKNKTFYIVEAVPTDKNEKKKHAIVFDAAYNTHAVFEVTDVEYGWLVTFDGTTPICATDSIIRKAKSFLI